jgi:hypothetical protein
MCFQYRQYSDSGTEITSNLGDNCFHIDDKICLIRNIILSSTGTVSVVYDHFKNVKHFYQCPLDSRALGVSVVSSLSEKLKVVDVSAVGSTLCCP